MTFNGKGQRGIRETYNGESTRVRNLNVRKISFASFMFFNYPESWGVGDLWRMFKGYGIVFDIYMVKKRLKNGKKKYGFVRFKNITDVEFLYNRLCSINFAGTQRLKVFLAHDRKTGPSFTENSKVEDGKQHARGGASDRDGRRYIDVLNNGMGRVVREANKKGETGGGKERVKGRELSIEEDEMNEDVIKRGIVGEVKKINYIEKLPELCNTEGLLNVEVKYMGGLDVMVVVESEKTVKHVIENTEHGIRRWLRKLRRANNIVKSNGRLSWLTIMGLPVACWNERVFKRIASQWGEVMELCGKVYKDRQNNFTSQAKVYKAKISLLNKLANCSFNGSQGVIAGRVLIHTWKENLICEEIIIKIGKSRCKVMIKEEVRDIMQFNINDPVCQVPEEEILKHCHMQVDKVNESDDEEGGGGGGESPEDQESGSQSPIQSNGEKAAFDNINDETEKVQNNVSSDSDDSRKKEKGARRRSFHLAKKVARRRRSSTDSKLRMGAISDEYKAEHILGPAPRQMVLEIAISNRCLWSVDVSVCLIFVMKIISLNIRGVKRKGKADWIKEIIRKESPCVLGLQETKYTNISEDWVEELWGSRNFGFAQADAVGRSGGNLLIWDSNILSASGVFVGERFVAVRGSWKGIEGDVMLANIYEAHVTEKEMAIWNQISNLMVKTRGAWCLFGDFNKVREPSDRLN
ncbi:RNA-directed DNA polymerase, eukaryota [Artemisia annua]|uniref:RNA-directed DNA polymerase, eukaryota n=1 Tax=Artemisia annua TaxID=35608 RepID=A0A2U1NTQ1_ARTAN|nr:RNA-directed DNA polymerase, eukaryota [Artemisia annua]